MKSKALITSLMITVCAFWGPLNSTVLSGDHEERIKYYESCIVKEIVKCESKLVLLSSSKSKNLLNYAEMEAQKARFLEDEKEILVKEMSELQLEPKHYKVELFLNSRFLESN
ncbi:MAG: hypothetical protein PVH85_08420 [Desulfobacterales bacterium]